MEKAITVGDLVVVSKPTLCCGSDAGIGVVGTVLKTGTAVMRCGKNGIRFAGVVALLDDGMGYEIERLKKLDAPLEDETVDEAQEVKA